jgi:hypothetical protein
MGLDLSLYIDEGIRPIETQTINAINSTFLFLSYALGLALV